MAIKSDAQRRAVNKYVANHYDTTILRFPKGVRDEYRDISSKLGYESFAKFCMDAIEEKIQREYKKK